MARRLGRHGCAPVQRMREAGWWGGLGWRGCITGARTCTAPRARLFPVPSHSHAPAPSTPAPPTDSISAFNVCQAAQLAGRKVLLTERDVAEQLARGAIEARHWAGRVGREGWLAPRLRVFAHACACCAA